MRRRAPASTCRLTQFRSCIGPHKYALAAAGILTVPPESPLVVPPFDAWTIAFEMAIALSVTPSATALYGGSVTVMTLLVLTSRVHGLTAKADRDKNDSAITRQPSVRRAVAAKQLSMIPAKTFI